MGLPCRKITTSVTGIEQVIEDMENVQYKILFFHSPIVQGKRNFSMVPTRAPEITAS
jgi:hypothetical protein